VREDFDELRRAGVRGVLLATVVAALAFLVSAGSTVSRGEIVTAVALESRRGLSSLLETKARRRPTSLTRDVLVGVGVAIVLFVGALLVFFQLRYVFALGPG
jgi:hypothetical protein